MTEIDNNAYAGIAGRLLEAIGAAEFWNGTLEYETSAWSSSLRATLIIYREPSLAPDDPSTTACRITNVVPVWWEFHTHVEQRETMNDFCWRTLSEQLT